MGRPLVSPKPTNLRSAIAVRLHRLENTPRLVTYAALAQCAIDAVCEYLAYASPLDAQLVEALNKRDDIFYGHKCEHCGKDPSDAEGDHDQACEVADADPITRDDMANMAMLQGSELHRYKCARSNNIRPVDAMAIALRSAPAAAVDVIAVEVKSADIDRKAAAAGERDDG